MGKTAEESLGWEKMMATISAWVRRVKKLPDGNYPGGGWGEEAYGPAAWGGSAGFSISTWTKRVKASTPTSVPE